MVHQHRGERVAICFFVPKTKIQRKKNYKRWHSMDTPGWFIADLCLFFYCLVFFCLIPVSLGTFIFPAKKKIPQNDVSDLEVKFWDQLITPSTSKTEETQGCSRNRKVDTAGNKFVQLRRHIRLDTFSYKYIRIYIHTYYIYDLL